MQFLIQNQRKLSLLGKSFQRVRKHALVTKRDIGGGMQNLRINMRICY